MTQFNHTLKTVMWIRSPGNNEFKLAKPAPSNMGSIIAGDAPDSLPKSKPAMAGTGNRRNVTSFKLGGSPMDPK